MASSHQTRFVKICPRQSGAMNNEHDRVARAELARRIARLAKRHSSNMTPRIFALDDSAQKTLFIPASTIGLAMARQLA
ncbi:hypothetical protein [Sphingobium yanoikuyae]|uniref:hypothetical protein n=1 Tax=Sphingobium yanoikuyae TaxID=13690 RepID=UPI00345E8455